MSSERRTAVAWGGLFLAAIALLTVSVPLSRAFERASNTGGDGTELALFPNGDWVRPLTFGHHRFAADVVWLQAIQYYGKHRKTDQQYPFVETLFDTLTDLDPHFVNAYLFGALVLAEDMGDLDAAQAMLQEGIEANPESWLLVFERGFFYYVHGRDPERAIPWLQRAGDMEGAPESVQRLAAFAAKRSGRTELALELWLAVYESSENDEIRRVAADYLRELGHPDFQEGS